MPLALRPVLALALLACAGSGDDPQGLSRDRFITAYVAMVQARIEAEGDSADYRAARDRALERLGVTPDDLRALVERGKQEPEQLGEAWEAIAAKLDTLYGGVTTEPPPAMRRELEAEGDSPDADGEVGRDDPPDGDGGTAEPGAQDAGGDEPEAVSAS